MEPKDIIGHTYGYSGIANMVYIIIVEAFEPEGEKVESDSYIGKQVMIFPNGESLSQDWCCVKPVVERRIELGVYKILR